jgi:P4 family phage/plasmid primase-like protien
MDRYSLHELIVAFPDEKKKKLKSTKESEKPRLSIVRSVDQTRESISLLGDTVCLKTLEDLSKCCLFKGLVDRQKKIGIAYQEYFLAVRFLTQLGCDDVAHEFARIHPLYSGTYDTAREGRIATQAIIDDTKRMYMEGRGLGYITYEAFGVENICGHSNFSESASPVRHFLRRQVVGIERYVKSSSVNAKPIFSAALAVEDFNHSHDVVFHESEARFYEFDGKIWRPREDSGIRNRLAEFLGCDCEPEHASKSLDHLKIKNLVSFEEFQEKPGIMAFANGILNIQELLNKMQEVNPREITLDDLEFKPFNEMSKQEIKSLRLTRTLGASFDRTAKINEMFKYLNTTFAGDHSLIGFVQEVAGYVLIPEYPIHAFFIFHGPGGNGKGVFQHILAKLVGEKNVSYQDFANAGRFFTAGLQYKYLNISDELPKKASLDLLKKLTGGGWTDAEHKFKPAFSFRSTAKLVFSCNELPAFTDLSLGFWSRLWIVPFHEPFRGTGKEIISYEALLMGEIDGIAMWALQGLIRLLNRRSFPAARAVTVAKECAKRMADNVSIFIDERCIVDDRLAVSSDELYSAFEAFCDISNLEPCSRPEFLKRMDELSFGKGRELSKKGVSRRRLIMGLTYDCEKGSRDFEKKFRSMKVLQPNILPPNVACARTLELIGALKSGENFACADCDEEGCKARRKE